MSVFRLHASDNDELDVLDGVYDCCIIHFISTCYS